METTERRFLLKDDIVQYYPAHHCHYTNANLTDEIAIEMLSRSPRMISNFEKYPENYSELLSTPEPEPPTEEAAAETELAEPTDEAATEKINKGKKSQDKKGK